MSSFLPIEIAKEKRKTYTHYKEANFDKIYPVLSNDIKYIYVIYSILIKLNRTGNTISRS